MIRKAEPKDISRIAEILVFTKRMKYRAIFHNDDYSFNELQVVKVANEFKDGWFIRLHTAQHGQQ